MDISTSPVHCQMYACEFFVVFLSVSIFLGIKIFAQNTIRLCALHCALVIWILSKKIWEKITFQEFWHQNGIDFFYSEFIRSLLFCEWILTLPPWFNCSRSLANVGNRLKFLSFFLACCRSPQVLSDHFECF